MASVFQPILASPHIVAGVKNGHTFQRAPIATGALVEQFKTEKVFWRQFAIATEITDRHDASVLRSLVDWLGHED